MTPMRKVPCNGCTLCCQHDLIMLHPEDGDDPAAYETVPATSPVTGRPGLALAHRPDGACVYLGEAGCTIHGRQPVICREFDCGLMWARMPRAERRRLVRTGAYDAEVFRQGRRVQQERGLA